MRRIGEDRRHVVMPIIDGIDGTTMKVSLKGRVRVTKKGGYGLLKSRVRVTKKGRYELLKSKALTNLLFWPTLQASGTLSDYICVYDQHRRAVARSNWPLGPKPRASGTL